MSVEFVSYDGEYPNLCSGVLVLDVDGKRFVFAPHSLSSGGYVSFDEEWDEEVGSGPWSISSWSNGFPNNRKDEAVEVVNNNVPEGCCGGCV